MDIIYMKHTINWFDAMGEPISVEGNNVVVYDAYIKLTPKENGRQGNEWSNG